MPLGSGYIHSPFCKHGKLGPRAQKCVFIRCPECSKGFVMFSKHPDGGMTETEYRGVDFLENEFRV